MKVIGVAQQKGGVGKSSITINLAACLARTHRVIVIDVDPQETSTQWAENATDELPFEVFTDLDPANLVRIRNLANEYDYVLIDTPGSLADTAVLGAVLDVSDFCILPIIPEGPVVGPLRRTIRELVEPRNVPYRVLLNRIDRRIYGQLEDWENLLDDGLKLPRFVGHIRTSKSVADAFLDGSVVTQFSDTRGTRNAISDFTTVAQELREALDAVPAHDLKGTN
ncbi:chromosome partitioning protein ParA [Microbacterium sp. CH12i]|uniref:ParA family protein n=1 Tax=Microbacterium sp. CH12i TaxID=1479651 RepID=UPI000460C0AD|nr:ParA family protein [Microbacterium sp. CH12i]KDA06954.1 chromosome partitioning protein ParA [Microbacterium sp. CH12i]